MKMKKFVIPLLLLAVVPLVAMRIVHAQADRQVKSRFGELLEAVNSGDSHAAFMLMTPSYRAKLSIHDFTNTAWRLKPLARDSVVRRETRNKVRLCQTHPGVFFSPSSTMTWIFEKIDGEWFFTGEREMWLD